MSKVISISRRKFSRKTSKPRYLPKLATIYEEDKGQPIPNTQKWIGTNTVRIQPDLTLQRPSGEHPVTLMIIQRLRGCQTPFEGEHFSVNQDEASGRYSKFDRNTMNFHPSVPQATNEDEEMDQPPKSFLQTLLMCWAYMKSWRNFLFYFQSDSNKADMWCYVYTFLV